MATHLTLAINPCTLLPPSSTPHGHPLTPSPQPMYSHSIKGIVDHTIEEHYIKPGASINKLRLNQEHMPDNHSIVWHTMLLI